MINTNSLNHLSSFLSSDDFFHNHIFSKNSFRDTIRVSKSLDPGQAQIFVAPDLGPNCLQRLSAVKSYRVHDYTLFPFLHN